MKKIGILYWDERRFGSRSHEMNKNFLYSIENAGGIPIGIPSVMKEKEMDAYLDYVDGVVLTGGNDISPFLYGEDPIKETREINLERDKSEYKFIKKVFERKKPTLAVCRGMQMANVIFGGNLYQDIESQRKDSIIHDAVQDNENDFRKHFHSIKIEEGSHLFRCLGDSHVVNSYHHQAIKRLADVFKATAYSRDGIIEGIETKDDHFFIGTQFHPEFSEDSIEYGIMFEYFVGGID